MFILILFAFLAGVVTVLSPCILPVLPIVLSGSVGEGKKRPLGVVAGFILSFTFFTLFLSTIVQLTGVSADALRIFSVVVIIGFGVSLFVPQVQAGLEKLFTVFSRFSPKTQKQGFWGGFAVGLSLGLIWTPCVGPILASVISLALTGSVSGSAFFITLAYATGTGLPMLAITYGGRGLLQKIPWLLQNTAKIQKGFGVIMILTGLAIFFNIDRQFQTWVLTTFPEYGVGLTRIEENEAVKNQLNLLNDSPKDEIDVGDPLFKMQDQLNYKTVPELNGGTNWINSPPLTFEDELKGKVVLIDFWTYSCINCIRTFPYVTSWYEKYKDRDFIIIGVHAPEFEFEKNTRNVETAMKDFNITYPVVQDNNFIIWKAFNNRYWPAHYLVDKNGRIRHTHFGEGKYLETEQKILELLGEPNLEVSSLVQPPTTRKPQTAETYLGYLRADAYTLENPIQLDKTHTYTLNSKVPDDAIGLKGDWQVTKEYILSQQAGTRLDLNFLGSQVFLVLAQEDANRTASVRVLLNGQPVPKEYWTADMDEEGKILVSNSRKYDIINLKKEYGRHELSLEFDRGIQAYAFTFGSEEI